ncbi:hypothetical protein ACHAWT_004712 [Skeletonema menzelii]
MESRSISTKQALRRAIVFAALLLACNVNVSGFCTRSYCSASSSKRASSTTWLRERDNNSNNEDTTTTKKKEKDKYEDSYSWAELQADEELRRAELKSSINRRNNMLLPQRISQAITTLGWTFVVTGIILNSLGFAWVKRPEGGLGIGTLDQRDFQREMYRRSSSSSSDVGRKKVDASSNIVSRVYNNAAGKGFIQKWASLTDDEQQTC